MLRDIYIHYCGRNDDHALLLEPVEYVTLHGDIMAVIKDMGLNLGRQSLVIWVDSTELHELLKAENFLQQIVLERCVHGV